MTAGGYLLSSRKGTHIPAIGIDITLKTDGGSTREAYSLFEYSIPAGIHGPPPHVHTREDESFICLAGRVEVLLGGEKHEMEHGDYMLLPRDVVHTFGNPYDEEARVISVVSPAGLEGYYQALAAMPPGQRDMAKMTAIMADFGIELRLPEKPRA
jgi:mannose-6-phosphate isomerase-like protein (cupin superfamily)